MPMVEAAPTAQQQLLEQVRLGEATHREDLVQQSLYRLELIDPNNPDVVAARFRSLLRQGDIDGAQKQLDRLSQLAPSSNAYKSSRTTMLLSTPDGRQALQQARLQATTGHAEEAVANCSTVRRRKVTLLSSTGVRWRKFRLAVAKRLIS
ncbi:bcsC protein [Escherichia coli FDA504]|nr:cellulose synthase operon protein C [Escherichia coli DEC4F]EIN18866.1 bcsC protein [Escherichia coli FDA505]EIN54221.1 bcsC protein [Escherichia coli PA5]EKH11241.1 bcsC protein [Escherichia coli FDA506]EKH22201.1 bcsC protein [Escherichia coli FDA504]EKK24389.1 bcsC protein [Escherichia coli 6.0172]EKK80025.1 cellulose synthase operon C domain protein [Escherichia coli 10.0821]EKV72765.1 cellulose synthase operon C domain protein [Escherichia coli 89.0511]EKW24597.1 cellulose synthase 